MNPKFMNYSSMQVHEHRLWAYINKKNGMSKFTQLKVIEKEIYKFAMIIFFYTIYKIYNFIMSNNKSWSWREHFFLNDISGPKIFKKKDNNFCVDNFLRNCPSLLYV